jgi:hypothetical protein
MPSTAVSMPTKAAIPIVMIRQVITVLNLLSLIDSSAIFMFWVVVNALQNTNKLSITKPYLLLIH